MLHQCILRYALRVFGVVLHLCLVRFLVSLRSLGMTGSASLARNDWECFARRDDCNQIATSGFALLAMTYGGFALLAMT